MLKKVQEKVFSAIVDNWPRLWAPVALAAVVFGTVLLKLDPALVAGGSLGVVGVAALGAILVFLVWVKTNSIDRAPKGTVGFVVAIACDSERHQRMFRRDFVDRLRLQLAQDRARTKFHLIVCPRSRAEDVAEDQAAALKLLKKARGAVIVFGRVRLRKGRSGQRIHYMRLEGAIRHPPAPESNRKLLAKEFTAALPRRVEVPDAGSVFEFEVTSDWLDIAMRYSLGLAALMTGQVGYAEIMLASVDEKLKVDTRRNGALRSIARKLKSYQVQMYGAWLNAVFREYARTRRRDLVDDMDRLADAVLARAPDAYNGLLAKAIAVFVKDRNVAEAKSYLRRAKGPDVTWRFSLAFVYGYEGRMDDAEKEYLRAFKGNWGDATVPVQTEEFIQLILTEEPDKGRLYFCSALVNYHAKRDFLACEKDLRAFLASPDSSRFPKQKATAEAMLGELPNGEQSLEGATPVDLQLRPLAEHSDDSEPEK